MKMTLLLNMTADYYLLNYDLQFAVLVFEEATCRKPNFCQLSFYYQICYCIPKMCFVIHSKLDDKTMTQVVS